MASSFLQLLTLTGVCPYLLTVLHRGHSGQKMQCCRKSINSTKLQNCQFMHVNWFFYSLSNSNPHLTAQQHSRDFPHTMVEHRSWTPSELVKFLKFLRGKSKSISQKAELQIWRRWSPTSSLFHMSSSTRANPPWQGTLVVACSSQRSEHFSWFSVAENWAPLIFSCSHNQSNPFNLSNLHHKRKGYIWTQREKKNHIYKVCTIYTSDFLWDTLHQKKEGHGSETSLPIKCCHY